MSCTTDSVPPVARTMRMLLVAASCLAVESSAHASYPYFSVDDPSLRGGRSERSHPGQNGGLTAEQLDMARAAWRYFDNNFQPTTCMYNAVDGYPSTTMWDLGSSIAGMVSAFELGLIEEEDFDQRMTCLLESLNQLPFYKDELPNIAYNTQTLTMSTYENEEGEIGFSGIDLGRLLLWLDIVKERYPRYADSIDRFVLRWQFCNVVDRRGSLYGAVINEDDGGSTYLQEGRLGYEEYAAAGFGRWGFATPAASAREPFNETWIYGIPIAYDGRDPAKFGAHNYVVMESFLLSGIELNWDRADDTASGDRIHTDPVVAKQAHRVYRAQARRYARTGTLTARTEHQIDEAPWFVYDTVYSDGEPWNTISDDGTPRLSSRRCPRRPRWACGSCSIPATGRISRRPSPACTTRRRGSTKAPTRRMAGRSRPSRRTRTGSSSRRCCTASKGSCCGPATRRPCGIRHQTRNSLVTSSACHDRRNPALRG